MIGYKDFHYEEKEPDIKNINDWLTKVENDSYNVLYGLDVFNIETLTDSYGYTLIRVWYKI